MPDSGLSGSAEIPDPAARPKARGIRARSRRFKEGLLGAARGLPMAMRLGWDASPGLTLGLAAGTVGAALVPTASAYLSRLLMNAVVSGYTIHTRHLTDLVRLHLPGFSGARFSSFQAVLVLCGLECALLAVSSLFSSVTGICQTLLQERAGQVVQARLMELAARLDLTFFEDSASYDMLRHAQREAALRPVTVISSSFSMLRNLVTFFSIVGVLIGISPWLAGVALLSPIPAFIADSRHGRHAFLLARLSSPLRRRMDYLASLTTTDAFAKEIRLFGLGGYFLQRFRLLGDVYYRRRREATYKRMRTSFSWSMLSTLVQTLSYLYVAFRCILGQLSIGDIVLFTRASSTLQSSIEGFLQSGTGIYESNLYLAEYYKLLRAPATIEQAGGAACPVLSTGADITFDHVTFRYPGATEKALDDVCLRIAPGETVALVGHNGAGKSTLLKLLSRLYDPTEGRILLNGRDIRAIDPVSYRQQIGALFQDYVTYQGTVSENVGLGELSHLQDRATVRRSVAAAGADALVDRLPMGYDTPLGKWFGQGVELSGGEWQKVALSRAFMRTAPILILDEPTAALDARAEQDLFVRLRRLRAGRTTLYISHRFSTVRQADRIVLLSGGTVVEEGTHAELMARDGEYAALFALQAAAYSDAPAAVR